MSRSSQLRFGLAATTLVLTTSAVAARELVPPSSRQVRSEAILGNTQALRVRAKEVPLRTTPDAQGGRRGTLRQGAEVWAFERTQGPGCREEWLLVGPSAWACNAPGAFEAREPSSTTNGGEPETVDFARIGANGAVAYTTWMRVEQALPDAELQPGFFVGIVEQKRFGDEVYYRTTHDLWFLAGDAQRLSLSTFEGHLLDPQTARPELAPHLPVGWVFVDNAKARAALAGPTLGAKLERLTRVIVLEKRTGRDKRLWFRTNVGWLSERELRVPTVLPLPEDLDEDGRYLDIDTQTQTLVAYRSRIPWFATLVSTGRGSAGTVAATPPGEHRIWAKLLWSDMDNLDQAPPEGNDAPPPELYDVEAVPWVMFFDRGYGLHAAYWHHRFGTVQSHGCVNLSPRDARRLFEFASPRLGPGWQAAHPSDYDPPTRVRIR